LLNNRTRSHKATHTRRKRRRERQTDREATGRCVRIDEYYKRHFTSFLALVIRAGSSIEAGEAEAPPGPGPARTARYNEHFPPLWAPKFLETKIAIFTRGPQSLSSLRVRRDRDPALLVIHSISPTNDVIKQRWRMQGLVRSPLSVSGMAYPEAETDF